MNKLFCSLCEGQTHVIWPSQVPWWSVPLHKANILPSFQDVSFSKQFTFAVCLADDLMLQASNGKHSCLLQPVVRYLCSVQNWSALGCMYIRCYAHFAYSKNEHIRYRDSWFYPAVCQTTRDLLYSMFQINWRERVPQCGVRSKVSLHHRSCHRFGWQDSTDADHKRSPLPSSGTIASVCPEFLRVWAGQRSCVQLWRHWCYNSSLKSGSSCDWHPAESAKSHVCYLAEAHMVTSSHVTKQPYHPLRKRTEGEQAWKKSSFMFVSCWCASYLFVVKHWQATCHFLLHDEQVSVSHCQGSRKYVLFMLVCSEKLCPLTIGCASNWHAISITWVWYRQFGQSKIPSAVQEQHPSGSG